MSPDQPVSTAALHLVVDEVRKECDEVLSLSLVDRAGRSLPTWDAGAHIDLHLSNGMVRQYSLHNVPGDNSRYEIAVLREPNGRGGSQHIHEKVQKGTAITTSLPRNNFPLKPAEEYLFVAGGIGITPLLPMMRVALERNISYRLVYAGRSRSRMAFVEHLYDDACAQVYVSDEGARLDLDTVFSDLDPKVHIYSCGPGRLLDELTDRCTRLGMSDRLHIEHFSGIAVDLDPDAEKAFDVELSRTGLTVSVASSQTILEALLGCGIKVPNSCAEGVCGSCETRVLDGDVDHRDSLLDDDEKAENDVMMICCSRAHSSRLILDL